MKKILSLLLAALLLCSIITCFAEEFPEDAVPLELSAEYSFPDGAPRALLEGRYFRVPEDGSVAVSFKLTNRGELKLTRIIFEISFADETGALLKDKPVEVIRGFLVTPVEAGESAVFERQFYFEGAEKTASIIVTPLSCDDETELPPWRDPQPGNALLSFCNDELLSARFERLDEDFPVSMLYREDQSAELTITDPVIIREVLDALQTVVIGEETQKSVCDASFGYWFTMADGSEWGLSFEAKDIFPWHNRSYSVESLGSLLRVRLK